MRRLLALVVLLMLPSTGSARLEVCNETDLVLMVAVGYDTYQDRIASEGWWRIYPGYCEVPVDATLIKGSYYVHAESNPRSTMPNDAFTWGDEKSLCVQLSDFRLPNGKDCFDNDVKIQFNQVDKNWRNLNRVNIRHRTRTYQNQFRVRVAGLQRLLSVLGYDVGDIDGVIGEKTVAAMHEIGVTEQVFGFDFLKVFPILEATIAKDQKLDN